MLLLHLIKQLWLSDCQYWGSLLLKLSSCVLRHLEKYCLNSLKANDFRICTFTRYETVPESESREIVFQQEEAEST